MILQLSSQTHSTNSVKLWSFISFISFSLASKPRNY